MALTDKVMFGWPMVSDVAMLSGGLWTLPLSNLQLARVGRIARSTNADLTSTIINVAYAAATAISIVALSRHNLRSAARWRIRGGSDVTFATHTVDSGWLDVWPEQWAASVLPAGHPNAATRLLTDAQIDALDPGRDAVWLPESEVTARYWRIELDDTTNADGYLDIGRLIMAPRFVPTYNYAVGAEFGFVDNTTSNKSESGSQFFNVKPKARSLAMSFVNLPDKEAYSVVRDMIEELGIAGQLYLVSQANDVESLQRRSFLGTVRALSSVQYAAAGYSTIPLVVDEVL